MTLANIVPRDAVVWFAREMERQLEVNDATNPAGWRQDTVEYLVARLLEEAGELAAATLRESPAKCLEEAADVANFAMMIADKCTGCLYGK